MGVVCMSDLIPLSGRGLTRAERSASRELSTLRTQQALVTAQQTAKIEVISNVTESGLLAASHINAVELMLARRMNGDVVAQSRLTRIADAGIYGISEVVLKTARAVGS
jgi:hypothetical protein